MQASVPVSLFKMPTGELRFTTCESRVPSTGREILSFVFSFICFLSALWVVGG